VCAGALGRIILKVRGRIVIHYGSIVLMDEKYESDIQKRFGERVRKIRKRKGLSQEALAFGFWTLQYRAGNSSITLQTVYALPFVNQFSFTCAFIGGSCIIDPPMPTPVENMAKDKAVIT